MLTESRNGRRDKLVTISIEGSHEPRIEDRTAKLELKGNRSANTSEVHIWFGGLRRLSSNHPMNHQLLFETPGWSIPTSLNVVIDSDSKMKKKKSREKDRKRKRPKNESDHHQSIPSNSCSSSSSPAVKSPSTQTVLPSSSKPTEDRSNGSKLQSLPSILKRSLSIDPKLAGSRFRILNETLYTSTGPEAFRLFHPNPTTDPSSLDPRAHADVDVEDDRSQDFSCYHLGFRHQIRHWPDNPVDLIARELLQEVSQDDPNDSTKAPMILIADLGCGEAPLAKLLSPRIEDQPSRSDPLDRSSNNKKKKNRIHPQPTSNLASHPSARSRFRVFSFDLVADRHGWVTVAECSSLVPLPGSLDDRIQNGMMDVVVCCLSLMSTNWVGMILEARRILRPDGQLRIAEVTSRFTDIDQFINFIRSIGFIHLTKDQSNTHFILFKFKKSAHHKPDLMVEERRRELVRAGEKLLKPCIYKRR